MVNAIREFEKLATYWLNCDSEGLKLSSIDASSSIIASTISKGNEIGMIGSFYSRAVDESTGLMMSIVGHGVKLFALLLTLLLTGGGPEVFLTEVNNR